MIFNFHKVIYSPISNIEKRQKIIAWIVCIIVCYKIKTAINY